jgi:phosphoenolpyruvate-protein phosphotransferase (PTS system enzyme I)
MNGTEVDEIVLTGTSICNGIAIGRLFLLRGDDEEIPIFSVLQSDIENEVKRYRIAVKKAQKEIRLLQKQLWSQSMHEGADILEAHLQIIRDVSFTEDVEHQIRKSCKNAEYVFNQIIKKCRTRFLALADPYFRERSSDIEDIGRRIMGHLMARHRGTLKDFPPGSILFAKDLTPSLVAEAIQCNIAAILTEMGGSTSHASIVARAKGIPYVSSIPYVALQDSVNTLVIVDGGKAEVILRPVDATLEGYELIQKELALQKHHLPDLGGLKSETYDGYPIGLSANIDVDSELDMLHQYKGKGVGLYRSEFVFLGHHQFPSELEQYTTYRSVIEKLKGLPIVIRTFDVGGDKDIVNNHVHRGGNPFLGCRAIRFLFKEREVFRSQIRAILRAAHLANVSIMFPMVSSLSELLEAKELVREVQNELKKNKIPYNAKVKIGCMIEVPSAAIIADLLAQECDFLSIGTNDLVQYSLAADRSDQTLSAFYTPAHPGILRLIKMIVRGGNQFGVPVSICGEVASDPRFVPLLIGLGIHELSVAARFLPEIKSTIRRVSMISAMELAETALGMTTAQEIELLLDKEYHRIL